MSKAQKSNKQFEKDMKAVRGMFVYLHYSISEIERRENFRLYRKMKRAIHQLNLCRELARSLDVQ
jgi:hypothetical protein